VVHAEAAGVAVALALIAAIPVAVAAKVTKTRGPAATVIGYAIGLFSRLLFGLGGGLVVFLNTDRFDDRPETFWVWQVVGYLLGLIVETLWLMRYWGNGTLGGGDRHG
jgi:hypothetical protein